MKHTLPYSRISLLLLLILIVGLSYLLWGQTRKNANTLLRDEGEHLAESILEGTRFGITSFQYQRDLFLDRLKDQARWLDRSLSGNEERDRRVLDRAVLSRAVDTIYVFDDGLRLVTRYSSTPEMDSRPTVQPQDPLSWEKQRRPELPLEKLTERLGEFVRSDGKELVESRLGSGRFGIRHPVTVAVKRDEGGVIVVHSRTGPVVGKREIRGIENLFQTLALSPKILYVALVDGEGNALAHSDWKRAGKPYESPEKTDPAVMIVSREIPLEQGDAARLVVALSTERMHKDLEQAKRHIVFFAAAAASMGITGFLLLFHLQRKNQEKLRNLQEAVDRSKNLAVLGQMSATVAHEIRNPLNAISLIVQRLSQEAAKDPTHPDRSTRYTGLIRSEIRRLNTIVEEFLELARSPKIEYRTVNLTDWVSQTVTLYEPEALEKRVEIVWEPPTGRLEVKMDPEKMHQALGNVLRNSLEACAAGGRITVVTGSDKGRVRIEVTDTGPGLPEGDAQRLFEPFFTTKSRGSGLGLSTAARIVEGHGGAMTLESLPQKGARCVIRLPKRQGES